MKWIDCSDHMSQYDSVKDWYKGKFGRRYDAGLSALAGVNSGVSVFCQYLK